MPSYHCCYGVCNSSAKRGRPGYDENVRFYRFPQPCLLLRDNILNWDIAVEKNHVKTCAKCKITAVWMSKCKRADIKFQKVRHITKDTMICSKHFDDPPSVMDYAKYIPCSTPCSTSSSLYRRRNRAEGRTPIRRQEPSANDDNMAICPTLSAEEVPLELEGGYPLNEIEVPTANIIIENENDDIFGLQNQTADESVRSSHICTASSTQTTWKLADFNDLLTQLQARGLRIHMLEEKVRTLEQKLTHTSRIVEFEKDVFSSDVLCQFYTGLALDEYAQLKSFCENVKSRMVRPDRQPFSSGNATNRSLTWHQELLVTLARLRGGLSLENMACRLQLSETLISQIATKWIQALYEKFHSMKVQMFSTREMIQKHLPDRFRKFKNIRVIIDCAEIKCQRSSNFEQQSNCYSQYDADTTYKFLLGCAPNGAVTFISDLYEGSMSDREILINSELVKLLEEGDLVLADRGFTIRDLTDGKGAGLDIPAFLVVRDRLTSQEEIATEEIAANRIFVEHVVGRLKSFQFLQHVIPQSMRHVVSQTVYVCGCLLNFKKPFVK